MTRLRPRRSRPIDNYGVAVGSIQIQLDDVVWIRGCVTHDCEDTILRGLADLHRPVAKQLLLLVKTAVVVGDEDNLGTRRHTEAGKLRILQIVADDDRGIDTRDLK